MKKILTIGYEHLLLKDSTNVNALIEALGDAVRVKQNFIMSENGDDRSHYEYVILGRTEVHLEMADPAHIIDPKKSKAIPAKTGGPY